MGKSTIKRQFSIAMLNYQGVTHVTHGFGGILFSDTPLNSGPTPGSATCRARLAAQSTRGAGSLPCGDHVEGSELCALVEPSHDCAISGRLVMGSMTYSHDSY